MSRIRVFTNPIMFMGVPCREKYKHIAAKVHLKKRWFLNHSAKSGTEMFGSRDLESRE